MTAIASRSDESRKRSEEPAMKPSRIFGVEIDPGKLVIKPFTYITISLFFLFASACGSIAWLRVSFDSKEPGVERRVKDLKIVDSLGNRLSIAERCGEAGIMLVFVDPDRASFNARAERTLERLASRYKKSLTFWFVVSQADAVSETAARLEFRSGRSFPVLFDPRQELAERTGVESLPTAALIDRSGLVTYLGPIEDQNEDRFNRLVDINSRDRIDLERIVEKFAGGSLRNPVVIAIDRGEPLDPRRSVGSKESITYERDVEPILRSRCSGCHRPREAGPFPLLTYRDAAKRASFLRDIVVERRMPPWKPKSGFGDFLDEMRLTRHEIGVLSTWADRGAPEGARSESRSLHEGESREATTSAEGDLRLGEPDLILKLDGSFPIPEFGDEYRAFVLPIPIDRDVAISAVEFRPDNRRVVHHARLYLDPTDESRRRDQGDSKPGFASWGGNDILKPGLGAWTPGSIARKSPPGVGSVIKKGSDLVLLIHYHGTGKREVDRSSVGLFFSKTPIERTWRSVPLSTAKIDIPAGEARHRIDLSAKLPANVHAYSVLPHGHYLLREIKLWAILPDGSIRRLLWIDDWDFQWQGNYHFAVPIALPTGTELRVKAIYDNSSANPLNPNSPPRRVVFGPSSVDEMLGCHIQILPDGPEDERKIVEKWPHSL
jgi:hypothetical protein